MDILKIRALAKAKKEAEANVPAKAPLPQPAPPPEHGAPVPPAPAPVRKPPPARASTREAEPMPLAPEPPIKRPEIDDPLRDFLARYDPANDDEPMESAAEVQEGRRYLAFDLSNERYAASILAIREIVRSMAVTTVPRGPRSVLGVFSKRGLVMPVVDLAACLDLREVDATTTIYQRVLVVGEGEALAGLRVDQVHGVVVLRDDELGEVPAGVGPRGANVLTGLGHVEEKLHIVLDVEQFLGFFKTVVCGVSG